MKKLFFSKESKLNIKGPFLIGNLGLFVIVAVLWVLPAMSSWQDATRLINQQRQIYAAYTMRTEFAHDMYEVMLPIEVLPNDEIIAALADIKNLANIHSLETVNFSTTDRSYHASDVTDVRGSASFTGHTDSINAFVYEMSETQGFIRTVHIDFTDDGAALLQIEFSLFGRLQ